MASTNRQWTGAESRLCSEYLASRWPGRHTMQRVRVGQIPSDLPTTHLTPEEVRMLGVWRRWVDALVIDPPTLHVLEVGLIANPGDLSQLELYLRLVPQTPELERFADLRLAGRLVHAVPDPVVRDMCHGRGIACEEYAPPWVADYLAQRRPAHRRPPLSQF